MTRQEIEEQAEEYASVADSYDPKNNFKVGAEYGYNLAIEKALKWLKENVHKRVINVSTDDEFKVYIGDKTWEDFKKAMGK